MLAEHFLAHANQAHSTAAYFQPQTVAELKSRSWFGNVRELRNAIEHAFVLARGGPLAPEHLPPPVTNRTPPSQSTLDRLRDVVREWAKERMVDPDRARDIYAAFLADAEPPLLQFVLEQTGHNRASAADILGLHRATLRKKLGDRPEPLS
jgi:two-component system nitrogen regulation response regulator GlnG